MIGAQPSVQALSREIGVRFAPGKRVKQNIRARLCFNQNRALIWQCSEFFYGGVPISRKSRPA
jgi:hypothetical protein